MRFFLIFCFVAGGACLLADSAQARSRYSRSRHYRSNSNFDYGVRSPRMGPLMKLHRGLVNIVSSPLGLFQGVHQYSEERGVLSGMTVGVVHGIGNIVARVGVGAYEVATFPVPMPRYYDPILTEPEYLTELLVEPQ